MTNYKKGGCIFSLIKLGILAAVIIAVAAYFTMGYIGDYAIKTITSGTEITGGVGSIKLKIFDQRAEVGNFFITNPANKYNKTNAIAFKRAVVDLDLSFGNLLKKIIVIDEIVVDGFEANIETAGGALTKTNLNEIAEILQNKYGAGKPADAAPAEPEAPKAEKGEPIKFIIKKLEIKNGSASSSVLGNTAEVPLPDFSIENIGVAEGGMSAGEIAVYVLPRIAKQATNQILNGSLKATLKTTGDGAQDAIKGVINNLFKSGKK